MLPLFVIHCRKLDFSATVLPTLFLNFCQRAMTDTGSDWSYIDGHDTDGFFCIIEHNHHYIFWRMDLKLVTPENFMTMMRSTVKSNDEPVPFPGFSLCFLDLMDGNQVLKMVKQHWYSCIAFL
jgi:hypothetical protein